ncbi:MAG TPA: hypothetical protein VE907_00330 [Gammaproteobacteria bacterium]|nr:hypothetical protein [Gammaproteobacteria bacterium]
MPNQSLRHYLTSHEDEVAQAEVLDHYVLVVLLCQQSVGVAGPIPEVVITNCNPDYDHLSSLQRRELSSSCAGSVYQADTFFTLLPIEGIVGVEVLRGEQNPLELAARKPSFDLNRTGTKLYRLLTTGDNTTQGRSEETDYKRDGYGTT